ncbi:thiamine pyrophosphate-binding protein [Oceanicella actignis]|uniref:Acetolactate synthase-1/2/3 large subunit n=1 Tax=Oceanicella actignis TaxID=1189325 RepID=A0A1M7SSR2_9RHOB|nr:thiamine pyrophosphate-binding protein [Oceanicella actignis]SES69435.1 acetolactate synthase-1/2/3 large subunit [Oceanicella actignis]SHN61603.1 acetolactate synthase-1/2/3 large subunit [Oceanicella actignis]
MPASSHPPSCADVIARRLHDEGVRHAFGIPGGEVLALIEALERAGIRFHLARHENAAGFMAEGVHRMTGAPGVLVATVGPGVANAVNVVANAAQDRVPLIVLTGRIPEDEALTFPHQVFDHQAVLRPLVKASFEARPGACGAMIDKAVRLAADPRPGPVHVDVPTSVAAAPERAAPPPPRARLGPAAPAPGPALDEARAMFRAARRPVLIAGLDVLAEPGAPEAVRAFAERFGVPVATTYKAKGALPEDHPLSLGGHGLSPRSDALILPFLRKADMIVCAGYDPIEMRAGWRDPWDPARAVEFAAAPPVHHMHHARRAWVCGVAAGLAALAEGAEPAALWPEGEPAALRKALARAFAPPDAWGPGQAIATLARLTPPDAVVTVDTGAHRILLSQMWRCAAPGRLLQSTGLCTMGCALPLAAGAALGRAGARVVAVLGDGCLDMTLGELATWRDLGLPLTAVVLADDSLSLIELKQRADGRPEAGVAFGRSDYAAAARALGGRGVEVGDADSLAAAYAGALDADAGFSLIAARIPRGAYEGLI